MRRFFAVGAGFLNLVFVASVTAQNAPPHAQHHPAEAAESAPSTAADSKHDCLMKEKGGHSMGSATHAPSPQMGQAQQMPGGMKHCSDMHGRAVSEKPQQPRQ